jgi:hypothetical protein
VSAGAGVRGLEPDDADAAAAIAPLGIAGVMVRPRSGCRRAATAGGAAAESPASGRPAIFLRQVSVSRSAMAIPPIGCVEKLTGQIGPSTRQADRKS